MNQNTKHVFIVNPAAGKGVKQAELCEQIDRVCQKKGVDYEIHMTTCCGETTEYVRTCCEQYPDTDLRFYACGGDGTVSEAVNGAYGFVNASVGVIPVGTGNDLVRNFEGNEAFLDVAAQPEGEVTELDLLQYNDKLCTNTVLTAR